MRYHIARRYLKKDNRAKSYIYMKERKFCIFPIAKPRCILHYSFNETEPDMSCIDHRHFQETARDRAEHDVATWTESEDAQRALAKIAADYAATGDFDDSDLKAIRADIIDDASRTFGEAWEGYFDGVVEPLAMGIEDAISMALDAVPAMECVS